jgi:hypothetical protein
MKFLLKTMWGYWIFLLAVAMVGAGAIYLIWLQDKLM